MRMVTTTTTTTMKANCGIRRVQTKVGNMCLPDEFRGSIQSLYRILWQDGKVDRRNRIPSRHQLGANESMEPNLLCTFERQRRLTRAVVAFVIAVLAIALLVSMAIVAIGEQLLHLVRHLLENIVAGLYEIEVKLGI